MDREDWRIPFLLAHRHLVGPWSWKAYAPYAQGKTTKKKKNAARPPTLGQEASFWTGLILGPMTEWRPRKARLLQDGP